MAASLCPKMGECEKGPADSSASGVILIVNKIRGLGQCRTKPVFKPVLPDGSGAFVFLASPRPARSRMTVSPKVSSDKFSRKISASAWIPRGKTKKGCDARRQGPRQCILDYMPGFPLSGPRFHSFSLQKKVLSTLPRNSSSSSADQTEENLSVFHPSPAFFGHFSVFSYIFILLPFEKSGKACIFLITDILTYGQNASSVPASIPVRTAEKRNLRT